MELVTIKMAVRDSAGKSAAKKIRKAGSVPAVLYGPKVKNIQAQVSQKEIEVILKKSGKAVIFQIESDDKNLKGLRAFLKDSVIDPVSDAILHLDFYAIPDKEMIKMEIPIKLTGKAVGITKGGIVEWEKREVMIKAFPEAIPGFIEVDVTNLDIGHSIHLSEVILPKDVKLAEDGAIAVVILVPPKQEAELTKEEKEAQLQASLAEPEKPEKGEKVEKGEKAEKGEKVEKAEKPGKSEKAEKGE